MLPAHDQDGIVVYQGDCIEVLATLAENSVDCVCTDPPYLLSFMGKAFDMQHKAFVGTNEGQKMQQWHAAWATAVLCVLKPGGHMVAFGGTRTHHRLMCALEDAGFEIRDCLMWLYGSGFPKSHNVPKAIDKAAGAEREVLGDNGNGRPNRAGKHSNALAQAKTVGGVVTAPATEGAQQWDGYGTALKPSWEPIILARKPLEGTVAQNVQKWGVGALNIEACRIPTDENLDGGAYAIEGHRQISLSLNQGSSMNATGKTTGAAFVQPQGRWPANILTDGSEEIRAMFPETSNAPSGAFHVATSSIFFSSTGGGKPSIDYTDSGSAARFFSVCPPDEPTQRFLYTSKVIPNERGSSLHPTMKPLALMTWLLQLVAPPGSLVLDPFLGSGTSAIACRRLGLRCIGIDREEEYVEIALNRLQAERQQEQFGLFGKNLV